MMRRNTVYNHTKSITRSLDQQFLSFLQLPYYIIHDALFLHGELLRPFYVQCFYRVPIFGLYMLKFDDEE